MLRVGLIETNADGNLGSMKRYADLVEEVFLQSPATSIERINLLRGARIPRVGPSPLRTLYTHFIIAKNAFRVSRRFDIDGFHVVDGSNGYMIPFLKRKPVIATVHDVIPLLQSLGRFPVPRPSPFAQMIIRRAFRGIQRADFLIFDSDASLNDVRDLARRIPPHAKVYPPLAPDFSPTVSEREILTEVESEPCDTPSLIHIGNNAFYKNRSGVLRIFGQLANRVPHRLIMAGPPLTEEQHHLSRQLGIQDRVTAVVHPTDKQIQQLYRKADLLLFPSYYEGFGWPPIEAMAMGCPVVCSNAGSLREIVGDAAVTYSPEDEVGFAQGAISILERPEQREQLIQLGNQRARLFSTSNFREGLSAAYQRGFHR
jgi:glycosyltransferase involved in cell wall biosynthesis